MRENCDVNILIIRSQIELLSNNECQWKTLMISVCSPLYGVKQACGLTNAFG